jgi:hypothetical protein
MYNMVLYLCVLIVFSLRRESLKLILAMDPLMRWFCHSNATYNKNFMAKEDMSKTAFCCLSFIGLFE